MNGDEALKNKNLPTLVGESVNENKKIRKNKPKPWEDEQKEKAEIMDKRKNRGEM